MERRHDKRRAMDRCDDCVKDVVHEMAGTARYQKWVIGVLVALVAGGSLWSSSAVLGQEGRLSAVEANQKNIMMHMDRQTSRLDKLISLAEERNIQLQKHLVK